VRALAFANRGYDLDDCNSYPLAAHASFSAGRHMSDLFTAHRETIMAQVARYFFGTAVPSGVRRKRAKGLFNSLDNDGGVAAWRRQHGVPAGTKPLTGLRICLGHGRMFDLNEYIASRGSVTQEFAARLPAMVSFVRAFVHAEVAGRDPRSLDWKVRRKLEAPELTAKSYFLAEAEALSRLAKVDWARKRGDLEVTSLQHDGIIVMLPTGEHAGADDERVTHLQRSLSAACTAALGYRQPVEVKPFDDGLLAYADSDASDDGD
jgi:hypothetical protein